MSAKHKHQFAVALEYCTPAGPNGRARLFRNKDTISTNQMVRFRTPINELLLNATIWGTGSWTLWSNRALNIKCDDSDSSRTLFEPHVDGSPSGSCIFFPEGSTQAKHSSYFTLPCLLHVFADSERCVCSCLLEAKLDPNRRNRSAWVGQTANGSCRTLGTGGVLCRPSSRYLAQTAIRKVSAVRLRRVRGAHKDPRPDRYPSIPILVTHPHQGTACEPPGFFFRSSRAVSARASSQTSHRSTPHLSDARPPQVAADTDRIA